jgi:malonate-semialdehyde dehydrogenase (acetylating)/methylmalonate-semialdehyde dehydrogenase
MRTIPPRTIQHWIAGSETTGASTRYGPVWNPATGVQQAQVALAEPADVDAAVAAGDALVDKLKQKAEEIKVGPGRDPASEMGPVVTAQARDRISGYVDRGEQAGATLAVDGRGLVVDGHSGGFFVGPTLFDQVTTDMDIYADEIFGPVLVVLRAGTLAEAIDIINANPYGNGTAIFTSSGQAARTFQRTVQVGMIGINVPIPVPMAFYSFGGWKDSLFGDTHVHGPEGIRFYTRAKAITSRWPDNEYQRHHRTHMHFPTAT